MNGKDDKNQKDLDITNLFDDSEDEELNEVDKEVINLGFLEDEFDE